VSHPVRVLLADYAATRLGMRMALGAAFEICAEAENAEQAIRAAMREQPDVCLVRREIPGDGLAAVRGIARAAPQCAIIVLAQTRDVDDLLDAVRSGAIGYQPNMLDGERLRRIVAAATHEAMIPRALVLDLLMELRGGGTGPDALTPRESQVLGMLRRRHSTSEIAHRLQIAPVTVRRHISDLVHKLGVEDRSALTKAHRD